VSVIGTLWCVFQVAYLLGGSLTVYLHFGYMELMCWVTLGHVLVSEGVTPVESFRSGKFTPVPVLGLAFGTRGSPDGSIPSFYGREGA
jgi:hypothetical protein